MNSDERIIKEQLILKAASGDDEALEKAVTENMGLVRSIVKRFTGRGCDTDDLVQIGSIGLIKAIRNFNPAFEVCFSTYAVPMISGEIKRFLRDDGPVKVSRGLKELYIKIKTVSEELRYLNGREATPAEIAQKIKVDTEDVVMALEAAQPVESLYGGSDNDSGNAVCLIDKIANNENVSREQFSVLKDGTGDYEHLLNKITLSEIMKKLSEDEQKIIKLRYFKEFTQTDAAKVLGISQVQVSRMEKKILGKMKTLMDA
ncbi:MAG: sigma-70 family RNA polymerase sigma factor [Clostridia bacterium]|nr:sigma-70 family RNA polymerase sigma factor [Clostridia bacterium]